MDSMNPAPARSGSPSLELLYRSFAPSVLRLGRAEGLDPAEADDLVQQTFIRVIAAFDRLDASRPLDAYINTIARNLLRNGRRGLGTRRGLAGAMREHEQQRRTEDTPDYDVAMRKFVDRVLDLIRTMQPAQRDALVAIRIEGLSYTEAAARFGKSEAAIRQDVSRAARALCEALGVEPGSEPSTGSPCPWCADE